jgi:hypothetical protein
MGSFLLPLCAHSSCLYALLRLVTSPPGRLQEEKPGVFVGRR